MAAKMTIALMLAAACGSSGDGNSDSGVGNLVPPPECALDAPDPGFSYPAGPYGIGVDDTFEDISLNNCDNDLLAFGDVLQQAELVLFNVGAGWCAPCVEETGTLDQDVFREFCGRGLRVVQVVFQDLDSRPATSLFCREWSERFNLSFPVLYDPLFESGRYFDDVAAQTPINFLIDPSGQIVFKQTGQVAMDLDQRIDALLPPAP